MSHNTIGQRLLAAAASASHVVYFTNNVEVLVMEAINIHELKVWFDGGCPLCRREIAFMRKLDRKNAINFIDVTTDTTQCPLDRTTLLGRFHAEENGKLLSGAAAFAAMWRAIPALRPLGLAARNTWILAALERGYLMFLRHRPKLQKFAVWFERKPA